MLSENIWFTLCKASNYWIFKEAKSDDGQTNGQTDKISSCRLDPFCRRGRVKILLGTFIKCGCKVHEKNDFVNLNPTEKFTTDWLEGRRDDDRRLEIQRTRFYLHAEGGRAGQGFQVRSFNIFHFIHSHFTQVSYSDIFLLKAFSSFSFQNLKIYA